MLSLFLFRNPMSVIPNSSASSTAATSPGSAKTVWLDFPPRTFHFPSTTAFRASVALIGQLPARHPCGYLERSARLKVISFCLKMIPNTTEAELQERAGAQWEAFYGKSDGPDDWSLATLRRIRGFVRIG